MHDPDPQAYVALSLMAEELGQIVKESVFGHWVVNNYHISALKHIVTYPTIALERVNKSTFIFVNPRAVLVNKLNPVIRWDGIYYFCHADGYKWCRNIRVDSCSGIWNHAVRKPLTGRSEVRESVHYDQTDCESIRKHFLVGFICGLHCWTG